jgi:hypothetical protein
MRRTLHAARRHAERGSVAVEAAIVLSLLVLFVTLPSVFYAVYFYTYSAAQKAVHDAALYLSTAPRLEMTTEGPDGEPVAMILAKKIFAAEMAGLKPPDLAIACIYRQGTSGVIGKPCTAKNNQDYTLLHTDVSLDMPYLDPYTGNDIGMTIRPSAAMPYMGN